MSLRQRLAHFMYQKFNTLDWGCPACGGNVERVGYAKKAACQKCKADYDVNPPMFY